LVRVTRGARRDVVRLFDLPVFVAGVFDVFDAPADVAGCAFDAAVVAALLEV